MAAAAKLVFVTGFAELDAKMKGLPAKLQRKFGRKALRNSAKIVQRDSKRIIGQEAKDTGALQQSVSVRALKRSRVRIGVGIFIDPEKLQQRRAKKTGDVIRAAGYDLEGQYFYAASIEFGWEQQDGSFHQPVKPQRRALYDNQLAIKAFFQGDIHQMIRESQSVAAVTK